MEWGGGHASRSLTEPALIVIKAESVGVDLAEEGVRIDIQP